MLIVQCCLQYLRACDELPFLNEAVPDIPADVAQSW